MIHTVNRDINFLVNNRSNMQQAYSRVQLFLDNFEGIKKVTPVKENKFLYTMDYKDLGNSWSVGKHVKSKSAALNALGRKIEHMIFNIGCPNSVMPMIESIVKKGVKRIYFPESHNEQNAVGHFRWDWQVYTLTPAEIIHLKRVL